VLSVSTDYLLGREDVRSIEGMLSGNAWLAQIVELTNELDHRTIALVVAVVKAISERAAQGTPQE
jgi:hypothetical protein